VLPYFRFARWEPHLKEGEQAFLHSSGLTDTMAAYTTNGLPTSLLITSTLYNGVNRGLSMIHFFTKIGSDVQAFEFTKELNRLRDVRCRIFGCSIPFEYHSRIMFVLVWYPKLVYHFTLLAIRSMILSRPRPAVVVVESDVEVLVFSAIRALRLRKQPHIVYLSFIYTSRSSSILNRVRRLYYSFVLKRCARIFCHSQVEVERYSRIFPKTAKRFVFLSWGGNVGGWRNIPIGNDGRRGDRPLHILAAGRSGRDYPTLVRAVAGENFEVTVVCDNRESLGGIKEAANLRILRDCHGADYFTQLRCCDIVVVPLTVEDISQGQMVVVQAMAYGKPVVVTRAPTICDYAIENEEVLMVSRGDAQELKDAIIRLRDDPVLYSDLRRHARDAYIARHSQAVFTRNLVSAITDLDEIS
jgi:glycosyltransferase involved in cell wall biosynthesis